jgi:ABC-type transporter Mla MlaB component
MAAAAKKSKAAVKAPQAKLKPKPKSVAAPVKKAVRAKPAKPVKTSGRVETLSRIAPVANDAGMTHAPEMEFMMEAMPPVRVAANDERILLPARMELASLEEAHQLLQSKYPPVSNKYILDGGLLSVIDSAGIQMLISFIRSMTAKGCTVEWDNYSVQVYQLASELGVTSQLGD